MGLFDADDLVTNWRFISRSHRTADEWKLAVHAHLAHAGFDPKQVTTAVFGSVAPTVAGPLMDGVRASLGVEPLEIGPGVDLPVHLDVEEPMTVGADRIVNTLAAARLYETDTIVVDFGTATTFDCITSDARFLGGVIAPGVRTAADDLAFRAAKIPVTALKPPDRVIGRRTEQCVRSGILFGAVDAADGIVRRIKREWPTDQIPTVVATGGLATLIEPLSQEISRVEPFLTLIGLRIAADYVLGARNVE